MRPGKAAVILWLTFFVIPFISAFSAAEAHTALFQDTIKTKHPPKTRAACNVIATVIGGSCLGSELTISATEPIASVKWLFNYQDVLTEQTSVPFTYVANTAGAYSAIVVTRSGCEVTTTNSVNVINPAEPVITISTRSNVVCPQYPDPVFTGTAVHNGDHPTYQWKINGEDAVPLMLDNLKPFKPHGLKKGDVVTCVMTSTATCITTPVVTSKPIIINDVPVERPSVVVQMNTTYPCVGSAIQFTALPTNGGTAALYQWLLNDEDIPGATSDTYTSDQLKEGDRISCRMVSNEEVCFTSNTAVSDPFVVHPVVPVTPSVSISTVDATANAGTAVEFDAIAEHGGTDAKYTWQVNGAPVYTGSSTHFSSSTLQDGDEISCLLTISDYCTTTGTAVSKAVKVHIIVPVAFTAPGAFTPNGDGINDTWKLTGTAGYPDLCVRIYNRDGQEVFASKGYTTEWIGKDMSGRALSTGVYYYVIRLNAKSAVSGAVMLLR